MGVVDPWRGRGGEPKRTGEKVFSPSLSTSAPRVEGEVCREKGSEQHDVSFAMLEAAPRRQLLRKPLC